MRNYSKMSSMNLLETFVKIMVFDVDDVGKSVKELTKSYPNDFWKIYREVEHRKIFKKPSDHLFIGIVGTRRRDNPEDLALIIDEFNKIKFDRDRIVIVSGLCPQGGDRFATLIYQRYETNKLWFPAEWSLGRHAGFVRNTEIARWSDWLITTPAPDRKGGTEDTIKKWQRFHKDNLEKLIII